MVIIILVIIIIVIIIIIIIIILYINDLLLMIFIAGFRVSGDLTASMFICYHSQNISWITAVLMSLIM